MHIAYDEEAHRMRLRALDGAVPMVGRVSNVPDLSWCWKLDNG